MSAYVTAYIYKCACLYTVQVPSIGIGAGPWLLSNNITTKGALFVTIQLLLHTHNMKPLGTCEVSFDFCSKRRLKCVYVCVYEAARGFVKHLHIFRKMTEIFVYMCVQSPQWPYKPPIKWDLPKFYRWSLWSTPYMCREKRPKYLCMRPPDALWSTRLYL